MFCLKIFFIYKLENWIWSISRGMILKVIFHGLKLRLTVRDIWYSISYWDDCQDPIGGGGAYTETHSYTWENH